MFYFYIKESYFSVTVLNKNIKYNFYTKSILIQKILCLIIYYKEVKNKMEKGVYGGLIFGIIILIIDIVSFVNIEYLGFHYNPKN